MLKTRMIFLSIMATSSIVSSASAFAWGTSFSFDEGISDSWKSDWGESYDATWESNPNWGNRNWGAPAYRPAYPAPQPYARPYSYVPSYDRWNMRDRRQKLMSDHDDAMDDLSDMLYGGYRFDRQEAIELAKQIEASSGEILTRDFHPGAVATSGSNTAPAAMTNQDVFKANAQALKKTAGELAAELSRTPEAGEQVMYSRNGRGFSYRRIRGEDSEPLSPQIFNKFNALAATCNSCHSYFRMPD